MASDAPETIRAFLALELDATSLRRVARVAERLRMGSGAPSATWVPSARMHVTLKFMGELPAATVVPLTSAVRPLVEERPAPKASAFRLDAFPTTQRAQVIVLELLDPSGEIARLAKKVEAAANECGLPQELRPFRPHVTLARLKRPFDARRWLRPELAAMSGECCVASLTLVRSELAPTGPTHTPLARFGFV
jgi:RNA 2',3'-cyclic 3'-phosphodiesterase